MFCSLQPWGRRDELQAAALYDFSKQSSRNRMPRGIGVLKGIPHLANGVTAALG